MMYETEEDRENEQAIIQAWVNHYKPSLEIKKMPIDYEMDFALVDHDGLAAVVEVKRRKKLYDPVILSTRKFFMARQFEESGIAAFFIVQAPIDEEEKILWYRFKDAALEMTYGGRASRQKQEPLVLIPRKKFQIL